MGEAAPNLDNGSESSEELTAGKSAEEIARERMEKRVFEKAATEHTDRLAEEAHDPEGLGEDFERTQWLPPSLKAAYLAKADKILHQGGEAFGVQKSVMTLTYQLQRVCTSNT